MITSRFIHFNNYKEFSEMKISADPKNTTYIIPSQEGDPSSGEPDVSYNSISFVKDRKLIHTHGQFYGGDSKSPVLDLITKDDGYLGIKELSKEEVKSMLDSIRLGDFPVLNYANTYLISPLDCTLMTTDETDDESGYPSSYCYVSYDFLGKAFIVLVLFYTEDEALLEEMAGGNYSSLVCYNRIKKEDVKSVNDHLVGENLPLYVNNEPIKIKFEYELTSYGYPPTEHRFSVIGYNDKNERFEEKVNFNIDDTEYCLISEENFTGYITCLLCNEQLPITSNSFLETLELTFPRPQKNEGLESIPILEIKKLQENSLTNEEIRNIVNYVSLGFGPRLYDSENEGFYISPYDNILHLSSEESEYVSLFYVGGRHNYIVQFMLSSEDPNWHTEFNRVWVPYQDDFRTINGIYVDQNSPVILKNEPIRLGFSFGVDEENPDFDAYCQVRFYETLAGNRTGFEDLRMHYDKSSNSLVSEKSYTGSLECFKISPNSSALEQRPIIFKYPQQDWLYY